MAYLGNNLTVQQYAPQIAYFSGNGSATSFTLPSPVVSAAQILVVVNNVPQNPSSAYSVSGSTLTFTSAPASGTNNIWVEYTSLQTNTIAPSNGTVNTAQLGTITNIASGNSSLTLQTGSSNTTALTIDTTQNVGIGTTSPSVTFEANGQSKIYGGSVNTSGTLSVGNNVTGDTRPLYIENSSTSSTSNGMIYINNYNSSFSGVFIQCFSGNNGSQKAFINGAGTYGSATNTYGGTSDVRIKTNIVDATPKLNDLMKVRVVNYNRTDQDNAPKELGVIAQELEQIFPAMVFEQEVKDANNNVLCPDRKNVKYSIFVPMLIKAIQELNEKIISLENELASK
jgi:Chaperone of endosialidase